jgi:hypothetical protein
MSYEKPMVQELGDAMELTQGKGEDSLDQFACPTFKPPIEGDIWLDEE